MYVSPSPLLSPNHSTVDLIFVRIAIAIHHPSDVRPILKAYQGKDIALEYNKLEEEQKRRMLQDERRKRMQLEEELRRQQEAEEEERQQADMRRRLQNEYLRRQSLSPLEELLGLRPSRSMQHEVRCAL